jgi:hypothetical protein
MPGLAVCTSEGSFGLKAEELAASITSPFDTPMAYMERTAFSVAWGQKPTSHVQGWTRRIPLKKRKGVNTDKGGHDVSNKYNQPDQALAPRLGTGDLA